MTRDEDRVYVCQFLRMMLNLEENGGMFEDIANNHSVWEIYWPETHEIQQQA